MKLRPIIFTCTERHITATVTSVTLVPDGNSNTGAIRLFAANAAELKAYEVGKAYRLTPDPI